MSSEQAGIVNGQSGHKSEARPGALHDLQPPAACVVGAVEAAETYNNQNARDTELPGHAVLLLGVAIQRAYVRL